MAKLLALLFLIMFTLKLTGLIGLSWVIVTAPLWVPCAVFLVVFVTGFICVLVGLKVQARKPNPRKALDKYRQSLLVGA